MQKQTDMSEENVVQRLRRRTQEAVKLGFHVRPELLDGQEPSWCMIGKKKVIFIDIAQTAEEQLRQLNETLAQYEQNCIEASRATLTKVA